MNFEKVQFIHFSHYFLHWCFLGFGPTLRGAPWLLLALCSEIISGCFGGPSGVSVMEPRSALCKECSLISILLTETLNWFFKWVNIIVYLPVKSTSTVHRSCSFITISNLSAEINEVLGKAIFLSWDIVYIVFLI